MFGKKKIHPVVLNATKAYLVEMTRAILGSVLKTSVFLTQVRVTTDGERPVSCWVPQYRPYAKAEIVISVEVFFTALESPIRHGCEGVFPILPWAKLGFVLTSDVNVGYISGWRSWEILNVNGEFYNFDNPLTGRINFGFSDKADCQPPEELTTLAMELKHRCPASFDGT